MSQSPYLRRAEEAKRAAACATDPEARADMLRVAELWERLEGFRLPKTDTDPKKDTLH